MDGTIGANHYSPITLPSTRSKDFIDGRTMFASTDLESMKYIQEEDIAGFLSAHPESLKIMKSVLYRLRLVCKFLGRMFYTDLVMAISTDILGRGGSVLDLDMSCLQNKDNMLVEQKQLLTICSGTENESMKSIADVVKNLLEIVGTVMTSQSYIDRQDFIIP